MLTKQPSLKDKIREQAEAVKLKEATADKKEKVGGLKPKKK